MKKKSREEEKLRRKEEKNKEAQPMLHVPPPAGAEVENPDE